ncbi:hypothetical protein [Collimonas antrihumi]|uniref:hypothetical protein n=1 Tax=Collimonas antrihumi TaxID=1940615 RepID=UPI001B8CF6EB|nr:hypothetical protein [Collimonas antrihumi]
MLKNISQMAISITLSITIVGLGIWLMTASTPKNTTKPTEIEIVKYDEEIQQEQNKERTAQVKEETKTAIQKCENKKSTTYTDQLCDTNTTAKNVTIKDPSAGFVSPSQRAIAETREHNQNTIKTPGYRESTETNKYIKPTTAGTSNEE